MTQGTAVKLLEVAATNTTGVTYLARSLSSKTYQAVISGTITVTIQGSADGTNWYTIGTFTASDKLEDNNARSYVRAVSSGAGGGSTATVYLDGLG